MSACGSDPAPSSSAAASGTVTGSQLADTGWRLVSITSGGTTTDAVDGAVAGIDFVDPRNFVAATGCNTVTGSYQARAGSLTFSPGPMTKRACESDALTAQERAMVLALQEVASASRSGDTLTMKDPEGATLLTLTEQRRTLDGTSWTVTGVNNGNQAVQGVPDTAVPTMDFAADGTVTGSTGCNRYNGTWVQSGRSLTVSEVATTKVACEGEAATVEQQFLAALGRVTTLRQSPGSLDLLDDSGATQLSLRG